MLKESYSKISFPIKDKSPDSVLGLYLSEFGIDSTKSLDGIKVLFSNALRDFLNDYIGVWELGSLCFALTTDTWISGLIKTDTKLKKYVYDCVDIMWLSEGNNFGDYKIELSDYLQNLSE